MKLRNVVVGMLALGLAVPASAAYGKMGGHNSPAVGGGSSNGCTASSITATAMGNSFGAASDNQACWFNRVHLGGSMGMDIGRVTNKDTTVKISNKVADVRNVAATADIDIATGWTGHLTLNLFQDNSYANQGATAHAYPANDSKLDEAWVYYHDAGAPVYFKMGQMFAGFGSYSDPYTAMPSLVQMASQFNTQALQLGWTGDQGFNAAIYGYMLEDTTTSRKHAFGANASYHGELQKGVNIDAKVSLITDYRAVYNGTATAPASGTSTDRFDLGQNAWTGSQTALRKAAWTGSLSTTFDGFDAHATYVHVPQLVAGSANTKVNIWGMGAGYTTTVNVPMHFNVAWEKTNNNSSSIFTAKTHLAASVMADVLKNVSAGLSWNKYAQFTTDQDIKALLASVQVSF